MWEIRNLKGGDEAWAPEHVPLLSLPHESQCYTTVGVKVDTATNSEGFTVVLPDGSLTADPTGTTRKFRLTGITGARPTTRFHSWPTAANAVLLRSCSP